MSHHARITLASQPPSPPPSPPSRSSSLIHSPFVTEAYSWLLENIANPYPSPAVKTSLAQRHDCSLSAINTWFVNARRSIGWTALCRHHFSNCRADALDAAYRALVEEDPNRPLPADIIHAFVSVKVSAEEFCSSTSTRSAFASALDSAVKDMPDQTGVPVSGEKCGERKRTKESHKASSTDRQIKESVAENLYPSPDHSPFSSTPVLDDSLTGEGGGIPPPSLAGRKRRSSSPDGVHTPISELTARVTKRPRYGRLGCGVSSSANACLPSPTPSAEELSENNQVPQVAPSTGIPARSSPREQHLSDTGTVGLLECSRDSMAIAGLQLPATSDAFPHSTLESEHAIDEWFKANFDILFTVPPPVDINEPDRSAQWEVELFNYTIPDDPQMAFTPSTRDNQTSSTELTALESVFQSIESGGFIACPDATYPLTMDSVINPASDGLSLLPDFSQSIDWTTLFNEDLNGASLFSQSYMDPGH